MLRSSLLLEMINSHGVQEPGLKFAPHLACSRNEVVHMLLAENLIGLLSHFSAEMVVGKVNYYSLL